MPTGMVCSVPSQALQCFAAAAARQPAVLCAARSRLTRAVCSPPCLHRRFQWLFVRIEVELRKIQAQRPEVGVLVPSAPHAYPVHPLDAAAHAHSGGSSDRGGADSGSEEEGGGGLRQSGVAAPRGRDKKVGAAARMLPLVDLNPR